MKTIAILLGIAVTVLIHQVIAGAIEYHKNPKPPKP